jgi:hypothetical protein
MRVGFATALGPSDRERAATIDEGRTVEGGGESEGTTARGDST